MKTKDCPNCRYFDICEGEGLYCDEEGSWEWTRAQTADGYTGGELQSGAPFDPEDDNELQERWRGF